MDQASLDRMAQIALCIVRVNLTPDQRKSVKSFLDCHDCFDANLALYGAFCGEHFRENECDSVPDTEQLNIVADMVDSMIKKGALK